MNIIENVTSKVYDLLNTDNSGHGMDHINRVLNMSLKFAEKENANKEITALIALLHDVDDYKLFGEENAENLTNAKSIMNSLNIADEIQEEVLSSLRSIGYSKSLRGIRPITIEGKIVSDADMCDALGVNGILRVYHYSISKGKPFFDRNTFPIENLTADKYTQKTAESSVCHIFEKILKLKDLMLTGSGKEEAEARHQIVVDMLYQLFDEENSLEWKTYLDEYLNVEKLC